MLVNVLYVQGSAHSRGLSKPRCQQCWGLETLDYRRAITSNSLRHHPSAKLPSLPETKIICAHIGGQVPLQG